MGAPPFQDNVSSIFADLTKDFPYLRKLIQARQSWWDINSSYRQDIEDRLGDALIYMRAQRELLLRTKRIDEGDAYEWLELGESERAVAKILRQIMILDGRIEAPQLEDRTVKWR